MAITRVQSASGVTAAAGSSLAVSWPAATAAGNLLVAVLAVRDYGTSVLPITPPSGWTLASSSEDTSSSWVGIYYIGNAASRSGSESFSWTGTTNGAGLTLIEYSGVDTTSPLGAVNSRVTKPASTTQRSGSVATAVDNLQIGGLAHDNNEAFTLAADPPFTQVSQGTALAGAGQPTQVQVGELIRTATTGSGQLEMTSTISTGRIGNGATAAFIAGAGPTIIQGTSSLSGSGAPTSTGRKHTAATSQLSGHGAPTFTGSVFIPGAVQGTSSLTGSGAPASAGRKRAIAATSVTGAGTPAQAGRKRALGASQLDSNGSPTSTGRKRARRASGLTGHGAASSTGRKRAVASTSLTGHGEPSSASRSTANPTIDLPEFLSIRPHNTTTTVAARVTRVTVFDPGERLTVAERDTAVTAPHWDTTVAVDGHATGLTVDEYTTALAVESRVTEVTVDG